MTRSSHAGLALIARVNAAGGTEVLAQWNERWQAWSLIGGHREAGESFRECCLREVEEELGLRREIDFTVAAAPISPTVEFTMFSKSARAETRYAMELFSVEILSTAACDAIDVHPLNRWLSAAEIAQRQTTDGRPVSEQVPRVLTLSGILSHSPELLP